MDKKPSRAQKIALLKDAKVKGSLSKATHEQLDLLLATVYKDKLAEMKSPSEEVLPAETPKELPKGVAVEIPSDKPKKPLNAGLAAYNEFMKMCREKGMSKADSITAYHETKKKAALP